MARLLLFFRAGLDRAASAYGRNEPKVFCGVAGLAKSIFLRKGATLLGILCSGPRCAHCLYDRGLVWPGRFWMESGRCFPTAYTGSPQSAGCRDRWWLIV